MASIQEITGHVKPMALANAIHAYTPSSFGGVFDITLKNIKDCIAAGDRWFEEMSDCGNFRISTDSGFSAIVKDRLAFVTAPPLAA